ncbi:MAG: hypothetical protein AB1659_00200 [Thermodesulfobacteriota bacterium]
MNPRLFPFKGLALVSPPWPLFNRPSIQIASLKAYLQDRFPNVKINAFHVYLSVAERIGYPVYQAVSERTWAAEAVYAALLYPEKRVELGRLFNKSLGSGRNNEKIDFESLVSRMEEITESLLSDISWDEFDLAGFSISLCQMTASLY